MSTDRLVSYDPLDLATFLAERKSLLPREVREVLSRAFSSALPGSATERDSDYDLRQEVSAQLAAVKALRESAVSSNGTINVGLRDAKEALSATTSLLSLLTKLQTEIYNADRVRVLQKTTIDVMKKCDPELHKQFLGLLRERLQDA